ncbi:MAG: RNA polymerase sigma factor, partial [Acidimicrobiia bacterium]
HLTEINAAERFETFVENVGGRLRQALIAAYGPEVGAEATSEALAYAWEHWDQIAPMDNPAGYLYRVGQSKSRRYLRRPPVLPPVPPSAQPWVEPGLPAALALLSDQQRIAVILCHGFTWTRAEVAELLGVNASTVQRHIDRAMKKLRRGLGAPDD